MLCGISPPFGRLSPTRRQVTHALLTRLPLYLRPEGRVRVRLACMRHAASVDSEPGSNSQVEKRAPNAALAGGARQTSNTRADGSCVVQCLCQADTRTLFASTSYPVFKEPAPAKPPQRHTTRHAFPQGEPLMVQIGAGCVNTSSGLRSEPPAAARGGLRPTPLPPRRAVRGITSSGLRPEPPAAARGGPSPHSAAAEARRARLRDDHPPLVAPFVGPNLGSRIRRGQGLGRIRRVRRPTWRMNGATPAGITWKRSATRTPSIFTAP